MRRYYLVLRAAKKFGNKGRQFGKDRFPPQSSSTQLLIGLAANANGQGDLGGNGRSTQLLIGLAANALAVASECGRCWCQSPDASWLGSIPMAAMPSAWFSVALKPG